MSETRTREPWGGPPFGYDPIMMREAQRDGERWARETLERIRRVLERDERRKP